MSKQANITWIYADIIISAENQIRGDIIVFYNKVFLDRMKIYIMTTKTLTLD